MDALRSEEGENASLVARLQKDRKKYQSDLQKKNREVEALNREIAEIIRKATAKPKSSGTTGKSSGGKTTSTAVDEKLSSSFASNKGRLPWPVEGTVIESYGQHYHPVYKNIKLPFNNGVTLAVPRGAQAKAVFDGTVAQVVQAAARRARPMIPMVLRIVFFFSKLAQENKKQHKPMPTCVVSGGILSVSYRPRENRRPASKSILTGWIVRRERGWPQSK